MKKVIFIIVGGLLLSGCFVVRRDIVPSNPMFDQGRGWFFDSNLGE